MMIGPLLVLLALAQGALPMPPAAFTYRFDEVKSKVWRAPEGDVRQEVRVEKGHAALPGDLVRTGFFGSAVVAVPERASRFEIGSSTSVRLAETEPGVLLVVEKGRIKAFFEKLAEGMDRERRVAAPGALLAVRGTRYGLEVGSDGTSLLAVFEGTVEVIPAGREPLFVGAQEICTFGPRMEPRREPMSRRGMSEGSWGRHVPPQDDAPGGMPGRGGAPGQPGGMPGGGSPGGGMPGMGGGGPKH